MKILGFAGTNSRKSINRDLLDFVLSKFPEADIETVDLADYEMPIYGIDREVEEGIPSLAVNFAQKVDEADLVIMSLAEHNGTYSVAFKNIFDWISRIPGRPHWGDKDIFVMTTSTGSRGGMGVLNAAVSRFPFNGGKVIESFSLPKFYQNFSPEKGILDEAKKQEINEKIASIKKKILSHSYSK